jgi:hypothetical protein
MKNQLENLENLLCKKQTELTYLIHSPAFGRGSAFIHARLDLLNEEISSLKEQINIEKKLDV